MTHIITIICYTGKIISMQQRCSDMFNVQHDKSAAWCNGEMPMIIMCMIIKGCAMATWLKAR